MPLYDFKCRKCGKKFEELVRLGDSPVCPKCGAADAERLFSMTAGISTSTTRGRSTRVGRRKAQSTKREKDHADALYRKNYLKEHS